MSDLISRQAAIDVLAAMQGRCTSKAALIQNSKIWQQIKDLPSVQPVDKDINVSCKDAIGRQAAIDTEGLDEQIRCEMCRNPMHTNRGCDGNCKYDEKLYERIMQILGERIKPLPSVQPEPLTDKEQRIFLAAMGREEKVCKQVDDECRDCREPYEDSLVRTCHEITRKVKGALWTN